MANIREELKHVKETAWRHTYHRLHNLPGAYLYGVMLLEAEERALKAGYGWGEIYAAAEKGRTEAWEGL